MEVNSSLSEISFDFSVKSESSLNDGSYLLLNCSLELLEMLVKESIIDSV
jgi:hypothetical protein